MEKQLLTNLLREDSGLADGEPVSKSRISMRQIRYAFTDWRIYLYGLIAIGNFTAVKCFTTFLPTVVEATGYTRTEAGLITAIPYFVACIFGLLIGYSSSRRNEHGYHLASCLLLGLLGLILMIIFSTQSKTIICISTTIVCCGIFAAVPLLLSWLTNNVGGHTKRPMAISFVMGLSQLGGIFIPLVRFS